jgi:hypothetical protein
VRPSTPPLWRRFLIEKQRKTEQRYGRERLRRHCEDNTIRAKASWPRPGGSPRPTPEFLGDGASATHAKSEIPARAEN